MLSEVDYVGPDSGFVILDGLAVGWYIHVNGYPIAGPWDISEEAEQKHCKIATAG